MWLLHCDSHYFSRPRTCNLPIVDCWSNALPVVPPSQPMFCLALMNTRRLLNTPVCVSVCVFACLCMFVFSPLFVCVVWTGRFRIVSSTSSYRPLVLSFLHNISPMPSMVRHRYCYILDIFTCCLF